MGLGLGFFFLLERGTEISGTVGCVLAYCTAAVLYCTVLRLDIICL